MVSRNPSAASAAEAEAAAWLARLHGPEREAETEAGLKAWLRDSAENRDAFERATEIWDMIPGAARQAHAPAVRPPARRRLLVPALALLLLIALAGSVIGLATRAPVYQTSIGGQQMVMLDDGTRVSLNTDSRIAILYSKGERRVRLDRGEALFEVAHNPARPFIVEAGGEEVRALGTVFLVRRHADATTAVTLLQGRVQVSRGAPLAVLDPGERLTVAPAHRPTLDRPAIEAVAAWRAGEVVFENASLGDAAEELNRYSRAKLVLGDPALGRLRISGVFSTGDIGEVADAIAALHRLKVSRSGDAIELSGN